MQKLPLFLAASGLFAASAAHAQYAAPAARGPSSSAQWEADAGVGYVFNTNLNGLDNGAAIHLGAYKLEAANATRETVTKFGGELYISRITGNGNAELNTAFASADIGVAYKFSRTLEAGITGGLGAGRLSTDFAGFNDDTLAFGFQIRPELIFNVSDKVGISLAYRYLHTFPLDSNWNENPSQHVLELSARIRF